MSAPERIDAFLKTADEDLEAAEALAKLGNRLAAFHVQQAIEKVTKAALLAAGVEAGIEHHLDALLKRLPEGDATREALWPLRGYATFATAFSYPTPGGRLVAAPSRKELDAAMATIRSHSTELRSRFKNERHR
jgi:hypothetical protein